MDNQPGFFQRVYEVARLIPHGRITSYGAIAAYLGSKGSARMVGWAMNSSKNLPQNLPARWLIPCTPAPAKTGGCCQKKYYSTSITQRFPGIRSRVFCIQKYPVVV